mgnify:CR=1 FL=1
MVKYIAILSICLIGCSTNSVNTFNHKAVASASITDAVMKKQDHPEVGVECDGSGYIIHGDGNKTKCPGCKKCKDIGAVPEKNCICDSCTCTNCRCEGGECHCKNCTGTTQTKLEKEVPKVEEKIYNVKLLSNGNYQICNQFRCYRVYSYNNARALSIRTRQSILVAVDVPQKDLAGLIAKAAQNKWIFVYHPKADKVLKAGVHEFSAPDK